MTYNKCVPNDVRRGFCIYCFFGVLFFIFILLIYNFDVGIFALLMYLGISPGMAIGLYCRGLI